MKKRPSNIVEVKLQDEILKMARQDGVRDIRELDVPVNMTRKEYYAAAIYSYYNGYDVGYADAIRLRGRALLRRMLIVFIVGAALSSGVTYGVLRMWGNG
jgi:hypothetical protein